MISTKSLAAEHLKEAISLRTISQVEENLMNQDEFQRFLDFLERTYPLVHERAKIEMISSYSPVYHLQGRNKEELPVLLLAHYDVVPVEENTLKDWAADPFSGEVLDGYVYGRGALDDKNQVISIMEALEGLLSEGVQFGRDIYVALGFDEETGGQRGARAMASHFKERNLSFHMVLDEGGAVVEGMVEGLDLPVALIGVCEKGSSNIRITARGAGGHSSMPWKESSVTRLSEAVLRLSRHPMKPRLTAPLSAMLRGMAPYMGAKGLLLRSPELTFPVLSRVLAGSPAMNALMRTTMAMTVLGAGTAMNVMPQEAFVNVNVRILPGDTFSDVLRHMKRVNEGLDLTYEAVVEEEASRVSPHDSEAFARVARNIVKVFPEVQVLPYLMAGGTDSRKYEELSEHILRFSCIRMTGEDLDRLHSTNERIHVDNLSAMISFYRHLLEEFQ